LTRAQPPLSFGAKAGLAEVTENGQSACRSIRMCVLSEPFWVYSFRVECRLKKPQVHWTRFSPGETVFRQGFPA
jgi:hypothetical protein